MFLGLCEGRHMRSDFRNVSEVPRCVSERDSKGQGGTDTCRFVGWR